MTKLLITAAWTFSLAGALAMALAANAARHDVQRQAPAPASCTAVLAPGQSC